VTAAVLLSRLGDLGVAVRADDGLLRLRPASMVPPDLLAEVRAHKAEVLALLAMHDAPVVVADTLPPATAEQAADEAADRAAIAAEPLLHDSPPANEPHSDMVEAMAVAMARNMMKSAIYAGTDADAALIYCRSQAVRRLTLTNDSMVRGLLLGWERHRQRQRCGVGRDAMPTQPDTPT
jgi:hypothetical protein